SGHVRGVTTTMPLHIEILYQEYNFVGAFAVASLLTLLAVVTLVIKTLVEWRTGYQRKSLGPGARQQTRRMLSRIQAFIDRLQLDTSRAPLGVWIALINVAIVVLVVGGISISAIGSLRDLANQQGSSRVQLAGAMAREDLRRYGEDAVTAAKSRACRQTRHAM